MQYNLLHIKKVYSKGIHDRDVGKIFVIYKPYLSYTHYRYVRMLNLKCILDIYAFGEFIGRAYLVDVKKVKFSDIDESELVMSKNEIIDGCNENQSLTKVVLKWWHVRH